MQIFCENNVLTFRAEKYKLIFPEDRPFVYVLDSDDNKLAELFTLSSVHSFNGLDDTLKIGLWEVEKKESEIVFSLLLVSSLWAEKRVFFRCGQERFSYGIEVSGCGKISDVNYFGGYYSGHVRWGSGFFWSGQQFKQGFNSEPNTGEKNYFNPSEGSIIDLTGVPLPGKSDWFFTPPPFCFAFEVENGWMGMGIEAEREQNSFTEYRYNANLGFHLCLTYEGHTEVTKKFRLPEIGFYFAKDEYKVIDAHVKALESRGYIHKSVHTDKAAWWYEPIFCGWGSQCYIASREKGRGPDYARQECYEQFMTTLKENGVTPGIIVLDDKWQATYGENRVDVNKWPDINGFIIKQHKENRKVLLWLKAWDAEGIPGEECITNAAGISLAVDPTNPMFEKRFRESIRNMLSKGGYDADGFKIDFTARIPSGPGLRSFGKEWGLELMKKYLWVIYDEAKKVKADALIMTHTPNPYLADVLDMIRLNDINTGKDVNKAMVLRARIAAIACPNAVIDTDNWPITNKAEWRSYAAIQPSLGVPSLYYVSHIDSTGEKLEEDDYKHIRELWHDYRSTR
jgi:hypothetical protein